MNELSKEIEDELMDESIREVYEKHPEAVRDYIRSFFNALDKHGNVLDSLTEFKAEIKKTYDKKKAVELKEASLGDVFDNGRGLLNKVDLTIALDEDEFRDDNLSCYYLERIGSLNEDYELVFTFVIYKRSYVCRSLERSIHQYKFNIVRARCIESGTKCVIELAAKYRIELDEFYRYINQEPGYRNPDDYANLSDVAIISDNEPVTGIYPHSRGFVPEDISFYARHGYTKVILFGDSKVDRVIKIVRVMSCFVYSQIKLGWVVGQNPRIAAYKANIDPEEDDGSYELTVILERPCWNAMTYYVDLTSYSGGMYNKHNPVVKGCVKLEGIELNPNRFSVVKSMIRKLVDIAEILVHTYDASDVVELTDELKDEAIQDILLDIEDDD